MYPRKPPQLKTISGTGRKDRSDPESVKYPLVSAVPEAPDWLPNAHAVTEWNRLAPMLAANRLLTEAGCSPLAVLCALHGKIVNMFAAGESPSGHILSQYRALVNDFGLTPVAQGRVKPVGAREEVKNPFLINARKKGNNV